MSQEQSDKMLAMVEWANGRVAAFDLGKAACIVYTGGTARLLLASGRQVDSVTGEAEWAIPLLVRRLEYGVERLLKDSR